MRSRRPDNSLDLLGLSMAFLVGSLVLLGGLSSCGTARGAEIAGKAYISDATPSSSLLPQQAQMAAAAGAGMLNAVTASSRFVYCTTTGWSMLPAIPPGAWVVYETGCYDDLKVGDVVIYRAEDGKLVEHRLIRRDIFGHWFVQGDNNARHDGEALNERKFVGRVVLVVIPARTEAKQ